MINKTFTPEIKRILDDIMTQAEKAGTNAVEWQVAECEYEGDKYNQYCDLLLKDAFGLLYNKYTNKVYKMGTYNRVNEFNKYTYKGKI